MAYATTTQFADRSGIGLRIVDENVGTGDDSETDFDLDKGNVMASSYTLNHAASGSNTFTALTETTHYTLDKESGKIVLTAGGVTELSTDILYATYSYTDSFSDSVISDMLDSASDEVDKRTGQRWTTSTSITEYYNGRATSKYPTTDYPYQLDYDEDDLLILKNFPVISVDHVFFLNWPIPISKFFNFDDGTSTFTDKTDAINSSTETPFTLFDDSPGTNDIIYIGSEQVFLGLDVNLSTLGTGSPAIDWEYWNGSAWTDLTESDVDTGASLFTASGKFTWSYPYGWAQNSVNSVTNYWVRGKLTSTHTIDPIAASMTIQDGVTTSLEPRQYSFKDSGILYFIGQQKPDGTKNIRVDYNYGRSSTPGYIVELTIRLAELQTFVSLSGGSYDDATSFSLGSKAVTVGEVYVNIREVIDQIRKRINEILEMIGKRADVCAI
jgi:hypothetical protein